ncbi:uncharacterized protein LOC110019568 isoform X2 [Phalaenopsis equestris]|uniref:uncharacterized protein LOC110019568 isoform X1 n=1 Tax=Phalaenopsis equestris TaxID=78828 RepID=UPI0009E27D0D|nr:uncharacterized protein LOC110019568 isoform X1 [Phalaenopsis equestris]XP_020572951.1 uncharacterized protein LOC110019568 isoform X2 [Phalaenopsis equestris]
MLSPSSSSSLVLHDSLSPPISHRNRKLDNRGFKSSDSSEPTLLLPSTRTPPLLSSQALTAAIPIATSISVLLWTSPVNAGFLSGSSGLESFPIPQLPEIDFLKKWNDENQKKYAEFDSRFRSSTVLKELLEKSKLNKERNKREIQDKYCLRGAEWGVGDCSTQGMTQEERDAFIETLKKKIKG